MSAQELGCRLSLTAFYLQLLHEDSALSCRDEDSVIICRYNGSSRSIAPASK